MVDAFWGKADVDDSGPFEGGRGEGKVVVGVEVTVAEKQSQTKELMGNAEKLTERRDGRGCNQ